MPALVNSKSSTSCASILAFVASEWALDRIDTSLYNANAGHLRNPRRLSTACNIATRCTRLTLRAGEFPTLGTTHCAIRIRVEGLDKIVVKRRLNGAQNQILPRAEIAREPRLERLPNAFRREFLASADRGLNELSDCRFENFARYHGC